MPFRKPAPYGRTKPPVGAAQDLGHPLSIRLAGHWIFAESGGKKLSCLVRPWNQGTITGTLPWVPGPFGLVPSFDGNVANYIAAGSDPSLRCTGAYSISAWANPSSVNTTQVLLGSRSATGNNNGYELIIRLASASTAQLVHFGGSTFTSGSGYQPLDGKWHLWTVVNNLATVRFYRDGLFHSSAASASAAAASNQQMVLGALQNNAAISAPLIGSMDDVRIYNRALTDGDVLALFNAPFSDIYAPRRRIISSVPPVAYDYVPSGGLTSSGSAALAKGKSYLASGGLASGGAAQLAKGKSFAASGGLTSAGVAATAQTHAYDYVASGGLVSSGAAVVEKGKNYAISGGLSSGGIAITAQSHALSYAASGGLVSSGAAALSKGKDYTVSGGLTAAGSATTATSAAASYLPTGGLIAAGAAALEKGKNYLPSGGLTASGAAALAKAKDFLATGGSVFAGESLTASDQAHAWVAEGGLTLSGSAATTHTHQWAYTATGGAHFGGAAETALELEERSAWSDYHGKALLRLFGLPVAYEFESSGGLQFGGSARCRLVRAAVARTTVSQARLARPSGAAHCQMARRSAVREVIARARIPRCVGAALTGRSNHAMQYRSRNTGRASPFGGQAITRAD